MRRDEQPASDVARSLPGGRWTVMRFSQGAPVGVISALVTGAIVAAKPHRPVGAKWVVSLGEFLMGEGAPVVLFSPQVPKGVVEGNRPASGVLTVNEFVSARD